MTKCMLAVFAVAVMVFMVALGAPGRTVAQSLAAPPSPGTAPEALKPLEVAPVAVLRGQPVEIPPPPAGYMPPVVHMPWKTIPSRSDIAANYPPRALAMKIEGHVAIKCRATAQRLLSDCVVLSEDPAGFGFGEATLKLAAFFRLKPSNEDGAPPEGGSIRLPIRWALPKPTAP